MATQYKYNTVEIVLHIQTYTVVASLILKWGTFNYITPTNNYPPSMESVCLPGDTDNTGDSSSNCDTAMGGVGAVMNHVVVVIHNYVLHTHT